MVQAGGDPAAIAAASAAASAGVMGPWEAALAANAASAASGLPTAPWPEPSALDCFGGVPGAGCGMPGLADYAGAWAHWQGAAWQAGMQWALEAGALAAAGLPSPSVPGGAPAAAWGEAPCSPEAVVAGVSGTPGAASVGKALERTPPTTAGCGGEGHSLLEHSPYDEGHDEASVALQTRLFAGEPYAGGGTPPGVSVGTLSTEPPSHGDVSAGVPLLRPPGLA
eukprot:TRINITY_DN2205_c0_g2_i2.p1 TRINITY_DN2205_c0_g2~~TRINITY_DN2205_c0_g2_i2.p1  ORF type:complete len:263 (-),score=62.16 TRINITY_DN2205_c0_g2_i2:126-797(-)